jgi:hypothetical protein
MRTSRTATQRPPPTMIASPSTISQLGASRPTSQSTIVA